MAKKKNFIKMHAYGLSIRCPIHKEEGLHRLGFNMAVTVKSRKNKRGLTGKRVSTDWFYCLKCDKPRRVKFVIASN